VRDSVWCVEKLAVIVELRSWRCMIGLWRFVAE